MIETVLLAKRLTQVSPYAARIEPLAQRVPDIMEGNHQLRPLWQVWCQQASPNVMPEKIFTKVQIKILRSFFEYLYFASDAFIASVGNRL